MAKSTEEGYLQVTAAKTGPKKATPGYWKPGQSGNPSGMSKASVKVRDLARTKTEEAIQTLIEVMLDKKQFGSVRVVAAREILDRGWGRPQQHIEHTLDRVSTMSDDELKRELLDRLDRLNMLVAFVGPRQPQVQGLEQEVDEPGSHRPN